MHNLLLELSKALIEKQKAQKKREKEYKVTWTEREKWFLYWEEMSGTPKHSRRRAYFSQLAR